MHNWKTQLAADCRLVEAQLETYFTQDLPQKRLLEAMRYSLLAGGKRIRPVLVLEFCRLCGGNVEAALPLACAIEMVHTYSLIHDDLPCMDDDDLRRGRPTNHKVFGEAGAVLAGDGLLTAAFSTVAASQLPPQVIASAVAALADAAGERGMVGGQILDMDGEGKPQTMKSLYTLHSLKTGALIRAACTLGVLAAEGDARQLDAARRYAAGLGMAFQICDDVLDAVGDPEKLGKTVGTDAREEKYTFVTLLGLDGSRALARQETEAAVAALDGLGDTAFLTDLAMSLLDREN
jgi:geranylgeranyl diphosphate synthase type II